MQVLLSDYSWDQKPPLSIVLVGLPDLWRRLNLGIHRSLWSRIHSHVALEHASAEDTLEYITHRLERVGGKHTLFASNALALLHEATAGQLREIGTAFQGGLTKLFFHSDAELAKATQRYGVF